MTNDVDERLTVVRALQCLAPGQRAIVVLCRLLDFRLTWHGHHDTCNCRTRARPESGC